MTSNGWCFCGSKACSGVIVDAIIIIISGLLRLDHRNEETRNAFLCRPSAFGFAHLTDEGGSTSSKVEGGIVSHGGRFKNKPQIEIAVRSELNLLERNA